MAVAAAFRAADGRPFVVAVALAAPDPVGRGAGPVTSAAALTERGARRPDLARQGARPPAVIVLRPAGGARRVGQLHPPGTGLVGSAHDGRLPAPCGPWSGPYLDRMHRNHLRGIRVR